MPFFKILDESCNPTKGSKLSACIDLYAREEIIIPQGKTGLIPLGVCIDENEMNKIIEKWAIGNYLPIEETIRVFLEKHYLQLEPRSSFRANGLIAGTGIIDIDYKDEIKIVYNNFSAENCLLDEYGEIVKDKDMYNAGYKFDKAFRIKKGDKVAQIMLCEHKTYLFGIETEAERKGGFGSTGVI